jgi:RimJ/RimL family protein N-acetyltransferase
MKPAPPGSLKAVDDIILQTERLVFRPFTPADFDLLLELHSDPQVQRYIGGLFGAEGVRTRLDHYLKDQAEHGFSKWKAYLKDGTFVGRAGISTNPEGGGVELGYTFARAHWGQDLASEAARGIVDWVWARTDLPRIGAFAVIENWPSRRVLEKVGMRFEREAMSHGDLCAVYTLERPA